MSVGAIGNRKPDLNLDDWLKKFGGQFGINSGGGGGNNAGGVNGNARSDFEIKHNLKAGGSAWDAAKQDGNITANTATINRGSEASSVADIKSDPMSKDGSVFNFVSMTQVDGIQQPGMQQPAMKTETVRDFAPTEKNEGTETAEDSTNGQQSGAKMQTAINAYEEWCKANISGGAGGTGTLGGTETAADSGQVGSTDGTSGSDGALGVDNSETTTNTSETNASSETDASSETAGAEQSGVNGDDNTNGQDTSNVGDEAINKQEQKQQETQLQDKEQEQRLEKLREREQQQAA